MKKLNNKVAAITGAGSGIGQALAIELARQGCHLALSDINQAGLKDTLELLRNYSINITSQTLDVADQEAMQQWALKVVADHGKVNLIFNNAGVALISTIRDMRTQDLKWLMDINFWGVVHGTKAFLPLLEQTDEGHIINLSSIFGLFSTPTQGAYNASKFAVRGFTECLAQELAIEGSSVKVSCVHPGGIQTNIARNGRLGGVAGYFTAANSNAVNKEFNKMAFTTPKQAAVLIINGVLQDQRRIMVGTDAHIVASLLRMFPVKYQNLLIFGARRQQRKLAAKTS